MRISIIADIHGNMEAFEAVLADIDRSNIDEIISLGDNIGYGPESDTVIKTLRQREIPSVVGNHEIVIQSPKYTKWFNPNVQKTLKKTLDNLSEESVEFIKKMPHFIVRSGCRFVHGFPPKSPLLYLFQIPERKIRHVFEKMNERLCFIGHTHELKLISFDGKILQYPPLKRGIRLLQNDTRYIINSGSVGQPRDGDNRAKYIIWDTVQDTLEVRFVKYDIEAVAEKILKAGLPEYYANRLR